MLHICFGLAKEALTRVQGNDNEIPFQKRARSAEQPVHIKSGAFQQAIWYETYHFWNRSVLGHNCHKYRAGPVGSSVNRKAIRYGFRGESMIDKVWCEHGLKETAAAITANHVGWWAFPKFAPEFEVTMHSNCPALSMDIKVNFSLVSYWKTKR